MSGFALYATLRNHFIQVENVFFVIGLVVLLARLIPRLKNRRWVQRMTTWSLAAALVFGALVSLLPLDGAYRYLSGPAESRLDENTKLECIVVLGGGIGRDGALNRSSHQRTVCGVRALERTGAGLLILSGGDPMSVGRTEGEAMAELALSLGVPSSRVLVEGRSFNTFYNAFYTAPLLKQRGIRKVAFVTAPQHCRRSYLCFRKNGIDAYAIPCGDAHRWDTVDMPVSLGKIAIFNTILYEGFGFTLYKLKGWI